jgi:DNA polymerase III psi subunit
MGMFFPYSKLHPLFTQVLHELQLSTSEEVLLEFGEVKSVCAHKQADHIWRVQAQE